MVEKPAACRTCGSDLEQPATGRPRSYCSATCRRAAEMELRRIDRLLERLEEQAARRRAFGKGAGMPTTVPELEAEIERQRARLLELLALREGESPEPTKE